MLTIDAPSPDHARTAACDSLPVMTGHSRGSAGLGQVRKVPLKEVRKAQLRIAATATPQQNSYKSITHSFKEHARYKLFT
jgi:hypothetical protein